MQLMKDAGFISVFLGIETPDESGLIASNKLQNTRRSLLDSVATIQSYGIQVMGGFILGFDTDREDIFDRMVEFIQKSGIPIAMVGLAAGHARHPALPPAAERGPHRRRREAATTPTAGSTSCPTWTRHKLVEGYRSVLKQIYSCEAYYERVKLFLSRTQPRPGERRTRQTMDDPRPTREL